MIWFMKSPAHLDASSSSVGAFDAKTHLRRLLEEVCGGAVVTITARGVPMAMLVPAEAEVRFPRAARRGRMKDDDRLKAYAAEGEPGVELVTLPLEGGQGIPLLFDVVDRSDLSACDTLYLQLAVARGRPLASRDELRRTGPAGGQRGGRKRACR